MAEQTLDLLFLATCIFSFVSGVLRELNTVDARKYIDLVETQKRGFAHRLPSCDFNISSVYY